MGGKTSAKVKNAWIEKAYDRINLTVPKGDKERIKAHADLRDGGSVNKFINRAITNQIARDLNQAEPEPAEPGQPGPGLGEITE